MRRQLALTTAAIASLIVIAFLAPLGLLIRSLAEDRALSSAEQTAAALAPLLATTEDPSTLASVVEGFDGADDRSVSVVLADDAVLGAATELDDAVALARQGRAFTTTGTDGSAVVLVPVVGADGVSVVRVVVPEADLHEGVTGAWLLLGALAVGLVAVAVVVADRLARSVVRPMADVAVVAERLGEGELDARAEPAGPPEVVEVATTLNRLAERIQVLLDAEREAVADLSHRLRTPITALRLDADGLRDPAERERLAADVDAVALAVDRLIGEARRTSRADAGAHADLAAVVRDRGAFWAPLAEDQGRPWAVAAPDEPVLVGVHADDLAAALDALLGNVMAHTDEGVGCTVTAEARGGGGGRLVVEDDGPGLPAGQAVLARGESGGGSTGLGLDIARSTAEASGGAIHLETGAAGGARIVLDLGPPAR